MRGTPIEVNAQTATSGIIPAHAGNTKNLIDGVNVRRDHPRACGEHVSPVHHAAHRTGIIPAHAGNTGVTVAVSFGVRDHPRACGEHRLRCRFLFAMRGSSPRMRGTLGASYRGGCAGGIIPAHAGNTSVALDKVLHIRDHPRACGEH